LPASFFDSFALKKSNSGTRERILSVSCFLVTAHNFGQSEDIAGWFSALSPQYPASRQAEAEQLFRTVQLAASSQQISSFAEVIE